MKVGTEWLVDASGCDQRLLAERGCIEQICDQIVLDLDLHIINTPAFHEFPSPGGFTVFYMLTESHLACHTYPECGVATFNLYCCRERPDWQWEQKLGERLGASKVTVRKISRGSESAAANTVSGELQGGDRWA